MHRLLRFRCRIGRVSPRTRHPSAEQAKAAVYLLKTIYDRDPADMLSPALSLRLLQLPVKSANVVLFVVDARTRASSTA
jgi:hypothetical protein